MPDRQISHEKAFFWRQRFGCRRTLIVIMAGLVFLCLLAAGLSVLSNLTLSDQPESIAQLSSLDKARLAEALHLKQEQGETVWPGWGAADIPVSIWNQDTVPAPFDQVVPYRLLIQPSEVQISGLLHESFHFFQAQVKDYVGKLVTFIVRISAFSHYD